MWKELSGTMPKTCRQRQEAQDLLKLAFVLAFRPLAFAPGLPPGGLRLLGKWAADSGRKLNWNGEGRSRSVRCRMRRKAGVGKVRRRAVRSGCSRHGPELANCGGAQGRKNGTDDRRCENLDAASEMPPVGLGNAQRPKPLRDDIGGGGNATGNKKAQNCGAGLHLATPGLGNGRMGRKESLKNESRRDGR